VYETYMILSRESMSSTPDHVQIPRKVLAKQVLFRFCLAVLHMHSW